MPIAVVVGDEDVDFDGVGAVTIRDMHVSVQTVLQLSLIHISEPTRP